MAPLEPLGTDPLHAHVRVFVPCGPEPFTIRALCRYAPKKVDLQSSQVAPDFTPTPTHALGMVCLPRRWDQLMASADSGESVGVWRV